MYKFLQDQKRADAEDTAADAAESDLPVTGGKGEAPPPSGSKRKRYDVGENLVQVRDQVCPQGVVEHAAESYETVPIFVLDACISFEDPSSNFETRGEVYANTPKRASSVGLDQRREAANCQLGTG